MVTTPARDRHHYLMKEVNRWQKVYVNWLELSVAENLLASADGTRRVQ
jgi:hypothetical protein